MACRPVTATSHMAEKGGSGLARGFAFPGGTMGSMTRKQQDKKREEQIRMFGILQGHLAPSKPPEDSFYPLA